MVFAFSDEGRTGLALRAFFDKACFEIKERHKTVFDGPTTDELPKLMQMTFDGSRSPFTANIADHLGRPRPVAFPEDSPFIG